MRIALCVLAVTLVACFSQLTNAAELIVLDEQNWDQYVPAGKEVDAIYGDFVLRNEKIVAVVAKAIETRHANLTVRNVGGSLIDLTLRDNPNDQLSAFYPHGGDATLTGPIEWNEAFGSGNAKQAAPNGAGVARLAFRVQPPQEARDDRTAPLAIVTGYELADGADYLTVIAKITNPNASSVEVRLRDGIRADGEFQFGFEDLRHLWWGEDRFWGQAYGIQPEDQKYSARPRAPGERRQPRGVRYAMADGSPLTVPPQGELILKRRVFPARQSVDLHMIACRDREEKCIPLEIDVRDAEGAVADANIDFRREGDDETFGGGKTNVDGRFATRVPAGKYNVEITSHGRKVEESIDVTTASDKSNRRQVDLPASGFVEAQIVDGEDRAMACRVAFLGQDGTPDPNFGPDSAIYGVRNLQHASDGRFRAPLPPGRYQVVISHGPEYDAVLKTIEVQAGKTTRLEEKLTRSVDTTGWLSADFHSHSSPSGDNTASQRGRVLNLLAEHIEFAPCTEHNRISTYVPHLEFFKALDRMATCCGIELTGQPLPLNHQNAFPLIHRPYTQDGGGPTTHIDPVVQIERLAMWDDGSDKLVQINHPNIVQMVGDRDEDGTADGGFERMFHYMDVIEVHPPGDIFKSASELSRNDDESRSPIVHWLQLLNLGYRVPGVVNTDAHWNHYGSGGLRNFIHSPTDDPAKARIEDLVRESEHGHIVITNGPFLEVEGRVNEAAAAVAIPGDDLAANDGKLTLHVRVQCPNWMQVNRVQLFVNGRPLEEYNFTRRRHAAMFGTGSVAFDQQIPVMLASDAHLVVAAAGEGLQLGVVYGPMPRGEERSYGSSGADMPVAVANPIYVDVDGNGFKPNGDMLDLPLPVRPGQRPSHGHDHPNFHKDADANKQATAITEAGAR
jgi:hypothetical protein